MSSPVARFRLAASVVAFAGLSLTGCFVPPVDPVLRVPVGSVPIGTANYPVPIDARFVSPGGLQAAIYAAPSGSTLVLRAGVYRESAELWTDKMLTIQPYPNEVVWFSGSVPVANWVADGSAWRKDGWTVRLDRSGLDSSMLIGADEKAGDPEMVFVDGTPLAQVASREAVAPGKFFLNEATSQLFIGDSPSGHMVEATVLSSALEVRSRGSIIRGIGFKNFGTSVSYGGAVRGWGGVTFENDVFTNNASDGLSLHGDDVARRVTATSNGQLGIHGYLAHGATIENSVISWNNTDHFNPESSGGGVKVYDSADVTMRGNVVDDNYGHGLWLDTRCDRAVVVRNITRRNARGAGVMFELSNDVIIAGNISTDNEAGIQAGESSNVQVFNNTMINNQYSFQGYEAGRARMANVTVRNNVMAAGAASTRQMLIANDVTQTNSWWQMGWTSDHNAFYRRSTATTPHVVILANHPGSALQFTTVSQATTTGQETHSLSADNVLTNPYVASDYAPMGPALNAGTPLPSTVAAALGQQTTDIGAPVG